MELEVEVEVARRGVGPVLRLRLRAGRVAVDDVRI